MKTNKSMSRVERMHREKVTRYSIRKYSFGAASVAVAALFMFLGNGAVSASELSKQGGESPEKTVEVPRGNNDSQGGSESSEPTGKPVVTRPAGEDVEPATPALDKTKLEKYIKEIEAKFDKGAYANKTEESVALLKEALDEAKEVLQNATTQAELTKAYSKLATVANTKLVTKPTEKKATPEVGTTNGQPTVGKKAENTEPKAGTNSIANTGSHDPRNGKAMDRTNPLRTEGQPAAATEEQDDSYASYVFDVERKEDLKDQKGHSTLELFTEAGNQNRNNKSITFGEDENGKYMRWESTQPRGGGFKLKLDKELGEEYTIGVKFSYDKTDGSWRKIVDYKNSKDDDGFYFANNGHLQFYPDNLRSTRTIANKEVANFIIRRSATNFTVYLAKADGTITTEFDSTASSTLTNSKPATITEDGKAKTILGFFFDDTATSNEATPGGKVYSLSIYDKAVDPETVVKKLNKKTVNTPASKTVIETPGTVTDGEKKVIGDKVQAVNPGSKVEVGHNGDTTVTPDGGKPEVIPVGDLVKTKAEAAQPGAGDDVITPASKTVVGNPEALQPEEKDAIKAKVEAVNPDSTVEVDEKGMLK